MDKDTNDNTINDTKVIKDTHKDIPKDTPKDIPKDTPKVLL